jgi:hypothetical protein
MGLWIRGGLIPRQGSQEDRVEKMNNSLIKDSCLRRILKVLKKSKAGEVVGVAKVARVEKMNS